MQTQSCDTPAKVSPVLITVAWTKWGGMLELPWSINEGQVEALAAPQSAPHPTLLDGKPEAALHAPTTNCGVEPPSKTGCAGRWSPLYPPAVHLHGPEKVSLVRPMSGAFQECACYSLCQPAYPLPWSPGAGPEMTSCYTVTGCIWVVEEKQG